jgi:hypothetical protein
MKTTTTFIQKTSKTVMIAAVCLQLTQCDSSTDLTFNPNASFIDAKRYDEAALDANLGETASMPNFLVSGDRFIIDSLTFVEEITIDGEIIDNDINVVVNSSGQLVIDNFRFNYNKPSVSDNTIAFVIRSDDHAIGEGEDDLVTALLRLRDTSFGSGSLAEALEVDPNDVGDGLVSLTETQVKTIQNAIQSLGYVCDDDLRVLGEQYYSFEADSTNQLLVDEKKITGTVEITKVWRELIFEYVTTITIDDILNGGEGTVDGGEYKLKLGGAIEEVNEGTFEIQVNTL